MEDHRSDYWKAKREDFARDAGELRDEFRDWAADLRGNWRGLLFGASMLAALLWLAVAISAGTLPWWLGWLG